MTGEQLYSNFRYLFPTMTRDLKSYKRIDPHQIELKTKGNRLFYFTYLPNGEWMLKSQKFA